MANTSTHWLMILLATTLSVSMTATAAAESGSPDSRSEAATGDAATATPAGADADGKATDDEEISSAQAIFHKIKQGGWTIVAQIVLSILGLSVALERFVRLRRQNFVPDGLGHKLDQLWQSGDYETLKQTCRKDKSLLARVVESMVKHRDREPQSVYAIAEDVGSRHLRLHLQRLFLLGVVATLEPLLGLLGTIIGMIGAFDSVAQAGSMGNPSILADDIAKALVTTAFGLIVAIPALFLYQYFRNRIAIMSMAMEETVSDLYAQWLAPERAAAVSPMPSPSPSKAEPAATKAKPAEASDTKSNKEDSE